MNIQGPILAATALGSASDEALRQAHGIAGPAGNLLTLVHVLPELAGRRPLFPELRQLDQARTRRIEEVSLSAMRDQWVRIVGSEPTEANLFLESGTPHSGVLQCAEALGAGLIVLASGSRAAGTSGGGVAERVVRHASCPVLIASPRAQGPVLAATDFSDPALPALEWGAELARWRGARFAILHAVEPFVTPVLAPEEYALSGTVALMQARREEAHERLAKIEKEFRPSEGVLIREGPADDAILKAAEQLQAQLIVVGTHGRTGLSRLTLGSVAESVVRGAHCSVLAVRLGR